MNKTKARKLSQEGKLSIGELRAMIRNARTRTGMSSVNPALPIQRVLDIYDAALAQRPDAEVPAGMKCDPYTGRMRPSRDSLIIANVLRDCAFAPEK
jgi:hypothetical protein